MSDLFYTFSKLDPRVRPLVFYIRRWAEESKVIHGQQPSPNITNYMLTCMVIFFLQRLKEPVLPPAKAFASNLPVPSTAHYITAASKFESKNDSSLYELLEGFFTFYSNFNFERDGLCIVKGSLLKNVNRSSINIRNPLDQQLNVCRNVIDFERDRFIEQCRLAMNRLVTDKLNAVQLLLSYTDPQRQPNGKPKNETVEDFVNSITLKSTVGKSV